MAKPQLLSIVGRITLIAFLLSLVGSAVSVTPVHAAGIVVNTSADAAANDGACTLREAIIAATSNGPSGSKIGECAGGSSAGVDTISFAGNYTITVGSQLPYITTPISIAGRGAGSTIIQAAASPNVATWRLFQVTDTGNLTLDKVTVRNGRCNGSCTVVGDVYPDSGAGIYNTGILTVTNSVLSGNSAYDGGAILNFKTLNISNTVFSGNSVNGQYSLGGAIYTDDTANITNSTFLGNSAVYGGGAVFGNFILNIKGSTFSGNSVSAGNGGGVYDSGSFNLTNSTFSGNTASALGGGIYIYATGTLTMINSTISGNTGPFGGGIASDGGTAVLKNTIVANNTNTNCYFVFEAVTDGGFNLDSGNSCGWGTSNGSMSNLPAKLAPLADNGGPTQTMKLLAGSPAIDAGNAIVCGAAPVSSVDQRGLLRPLGNGCDIGSFETSGRDGPDTVGVFRPSNGVIFLKNVNLSGFADAALNYGVGGDYPITGDWDGDGTDTIGVYRNGIFLLRNSNTIGFADLNFAYGAPGDQPVAGDWNGDGKDTIGVYRPSTGQFLLRNSNSSGAPNISFYLGNVGDIGIAGDWNGDGTDTTGVFRPSNGVIFLKNSNNSGFADVSLNYGMAGDKPVVGDWDDNGTTTIGIYRNAKFYLRNSNTNGFADISLSLGIAGDMPIAGNWDGIP